MPAPGMNWAKWPRDGAESAAPIEDQVKTASFPDTPAPSIEAVIQGIAEKISVWEGEIPTGIEKTAALRDDGSGDRLPTVTTKNVWRHPNAHPLTFDLLLLNRYGVEYLDWEQETLRFTLKRDNIQLSNEAWTKIQAVRVLHNSPSPWRRWEVFHWVTLGVNGKAPNFSFMEEPELGILAAAMDIMGIIDRPRETGEEVDKYVATVAMVHGHVYLPAPLDFAQRELSQPKISCKKCGTEDRDDNDVTCVGCGGTDIVRLPNPHAELYKQVSDMFRTRKSLPLEQAVDGLSDDTAGNMTYRLLTHWDYRNEMRSRLITQFRMLKG